MPGYNHYADCPCGWCVKFGVGGGRPVFDAVAANAHVILKERNYKEESYASCFVNPNARCPVCGAAVFFYSNSYGSRVFFDDLGHPWPKHGCTDRGRGYSIRTPARDYPAVRRRKRGEIAEVFNNLAILRADPRVQHRERHSEDPASVFIVDAVVRRGFANYVRATELVGGDGEVAYFRFDSAKVEPRVGDVFSTDGLTLSFRDLESDMVGRFKVSMIAVNDFQAMFE